MIFCGVDNFFMLIINGMFFFIYRLSFLIVFWSVCCVSFLDNKDVY